MNTNEADEAARLLRGNSATQNISPPNGRAARAAVTITIDVELAWGNWDNPRLRQPRHASEAERLIVHRLVRILEQYQLPVTWAVVAALLDPGSAKGRSGHESNWYAPDLIDIIQQSSVKHDFASHGGRHRYYDLMNIDEADEDLCFAKSVHGINDLPFHSFVYPRNQVCKKFLLERHGIKVYRGPDQAWHQRIRSRQSHAGRVANLIDAMLPITPEPVEPVLEGALVSLPGSMLLLGRNGIRRYFARSSVTSSKLRNGVAAARSEGKVFHLWFHPSNFLADTEQQFELLERFSAYLYNSAGRGEVDVRPMGSFG